MDALPDDEFDALEELYRREINFELATFRGAGVFWKIGDATNTYSAGGTAETLRAAAAKIVEMARGMGLA